MPVAFDAESDPGTRIAGNSQSWTHTPAGVPSAVGIAIIRDINGASVTGCTYGGAACAPCANASIVLAAQLCVDIYGKANPAAGAQTVAFTLSGSDFGWAWAITVTGSDLSTCFTDGANGTGGDDLATLSVPSATDDLVMDALISVSATAVQDASQTLRFPSQNDGALTSSGSTKPSSGSSTTTLWTLGTNGWVYGAASFKAAGGGGGTGAIPLIGRGPGMATAGRGGLAASRRSRAPMFFVPRNYTERVIHVPR